MNILSNNRGIVLLTVIMIIAILSLLAIVPIESAGTDVINAGSNTSAEQTLDISNSAMNIVLAQLGTGQQTNAIAGEPAGSEPTGGTYYYTVGDNNTIQPGEAYIKLTAANINSYFYNALDFPPNSGSFGFEYWIYGSVTVPAGLTPPLSQYSCYNGQINVIAQNQNASKMVQTGMTFSYCEIVASKVFLPPIPTSWFQLP